jgi:hypothetical protein
MPKTKEMKDQKSPDDVLASRELFSDGPADDERRLRIIFEEAGPDPTFTIRRTHADVLVSEPRVGQRQL